jgi:hypothetical protein
MHARTWVVSAVVGASVMVALPAAADPATANSIQLGVGFRYGFSLEDGDLNPWRTGIGLQGGYTLPNAVYLGGNFEYFFGEKSQELGVERSGNVWQLMAEGGYDLGLGPIVVRPKLGAGVAGLNGEVCGNPGGCASNSDTKPVLAPGAALMLLTPKFSAAVDLRYALILADPTLKALILSVGVGF